MRFVPVEDAQKAVYGRELEVLRSLRIDWTGARSHIRCPFRGHADRNPSWRWDGEASKAFCTCTSHALSIFDVWMKIKNVGFAEACVEIPLALGRTDLIRDTDTMPKKTASKAITGASSATPTGCTLATYAAFKGLPPQWLRDELGLHDVELKTKAFIGPAVEIPYRGVDNPPVRYRTALTKSGEGLKDERFLWKYGSKTRPYGVDRLPDAQKQGFCLVVEGESDCHTLWYGGFPCLGVPGNTNWNDDRDASLLADFPVIYIVAEPEQSGEIFLRRFARSSLRPKLRVIHFDDIGAKDPSELYLRDRDGFKTAIQALIDGAIPFTPPARKSRREHAQEDDDRPGQPLELIEREPWPESVNGAELIAALTAQIRRYVVMIEDLAIATALWIVASYVYDYFHIFPRLFVTAPTRGAGKSTLLDVVAKLVNRPLLATNITPGALFRVIDLVHPCLLLDEADTYVRDNEPLRGVINGGFDRNGFVIRSVEGGKRGDYWPRGFPIFGPLALAAIGRLHGTIEDRSIIISLQKRRDDEPIDSLRAGRVDHLTELARKIARFVKDNGAVLGASDPTMPSSIHSRDADNWRPLISIADAAGGIWPNLGREVAERLIATDDREDKLTNLLSDIRDAFKEKNVDTIGTAELVNILTAREDRLYGEQKLTTNKLGVWLKKAKLPKAEQVWTDGRNVRSYRRERFEDAFKRYLRAT
jgi:putative DNA primase/helicase